MDREFVSQDLQSALAESLRTNTWKPAKGDPFFGPFLKVERASFHINDLAGKINRFIERKPYVVVAENYGNGELAWTVRVKEDIPSDWATIVGDAVHNLRDALDIGISALPSRAGIIDRNSRWTFFPSGDDEDAFKRTLKKGLKKWATDDIIGVLKTGIQPYFGGNSPLLRSLSHLAIMDKHYLIAPVVHEVHIHSLKAETEFGFQYIPFMNTYAGMVEDGTIVVRTPPREGINVGDHANASLFIGFDQSVARVDYLRVIPTLLEMRNSVEDALVDLRPRFDPPPIPPII